MSAQPRAYKARGVVLRARNLGEADKIFTLFTEEHGKLSAVGKGVRRQKSHLGGRLEFMNEVQLSMHRGRNLDVIVAAEIAHEYWNQIVRAEAFSAASMVAELVDAFCEPDLALPDVYALLTGAIAAIGASDEPLALLPRFSLLFLDALGLAPPPESCARCGASLVGRSAWLDAEQGGLAGEECRVTWRSVTDLDENDVANFSALAAPKGGSVRPVWRATPRVARAIESLVTHHLGRRPKAGLHVTEFVTG
ncbi:MAG: DNA repair protein RecO [Candidatus Eremiobacteraeota bacterium]|nr:DNA repair protein RecO [Candidatus Eremiobacteraeota bacterium]